MENWACDLWAPLAGRPAGQQGQTDGPSGDALAPERGSSVPPVCVCVRVCVCATSTDWAAWRSETTCPRGRSSSLSCSSAAGLPGNLLARPCVAPLLPPFKVLPMRWLLVCCLFIFFANSTVSFYLRQGNRPSPLPPSGSKLPPVAFTYCFLGTFFFFFFFFFRLPPHRPGETATLVCASCLGPSYTQCSKRWRARAARTLWTLWTLQDKLGGRGRKQLVLGVLLCIPLEAFFDIIFIYHLYIYI